MSTTTRTLLSVACAATALAATAATASAAEQPATGGDVNASIVRVQTWFDADVDVQWTDGTTTTYPTQVGANCTGFFVSDTGDIATAGHCVEAGGTDVTAAISNVLGQLTDEGYDVSSLDPTELPWEVAFSSPTAYVMQPSGIPDAVLDDDWMIAQVVDHQEFESGDSALLRVADLTGTPPLPVSAQTPVVGDEVTSIGFPGSVSDVSDTTRQLPSYKSGTVSSRQYSDTGVPSTEIDAAVSGGMSGGPTIDAEGEVVGINSFGITGESQPFNFITDTQTLRDFLTRNGVELGTTSSGGGSQTPVTDTSSDGAAVPVSDQSAPSSQQAQGGTSPLIVVLGLTVVALLGGLVLVATRLQKSRKSATPPPAQPLYPVASSVPQPPSAPMATQQWQSAEQPLMPPADGRQEAPLTPWR